jgi:hypothetical protein
VALGEQADHGRLDDVPGVLGRGILAGRAL